MRISILLLALVATPALAQVTSPTPASHRLMFTPTARAIPGGQVSLGLTELVVPTAAVGVGGGVSLGAGVLASPQSGFFGTVFFEPKVTIVNRPGLAVALGATGLVDPFEDGGAEGSVAPYAVATVGDASVQNGVAATVGLGARVNVERPFDPSIYYHYGPAIDPGFGRARRDGYRADLVPAPAAFAGLEVRASKRVTILLEAAALPDRDLSLGVPCGFCFVTGMAEAETGLRHGAVEYTTSFGSAARVALGRAVVDAGVLFGREADGRGAPPAEVVPWLNVTLGLGR